MALIDTGTAIGSVSRLLQTALTNAFTNVSPTATISIARPEPAGGGGGVHQSARLNLFLYEVQIDSGLRNVPLTQGRPAPLWLVLRYLLTAFDENGESDTDGAHDVLGLAMQALLGMNESGALQQITAKSLTDNPQSLKITFDDGSPDLLSRLMQGPDDRFRASVPFQIRPVLVSTAQPPASMQLVGVNYTTDTIIGQAGIHNILLPALGPSLTAATPAQVQAGDSLTISGTGLGAGGLSVTFGAVTLPVTMQQAGTLKCLVGGAPLDPARLSAGHQPVAVTQAIAGAMTIASNTLSVALLPVVTGISHGGLTSISGKVYATITFTGSFLGQPADYVELALQANGAVVALIDRIDPAFIPPGDQSVQQMAMHASEAVPPGVYTALVRINGAQARQALLLPME